MKLNKFSILVVFVLSFSLFSCSDDISHSDPNFISFESKGFSLGIEDGGQISKEINVYTSNVSSSDRTFNVEVLPASTANPLSYTLPLTVTVPANSNKGVLVLNYNNTDLVAGEPKLISLGLVSQVGLGTGAVLPITLLETCLDNPLRIIIATDAYGTETSWELYDSELNVIAEGGPYADQSAAGVYIVDTRDFCLPDGNYTFVAYDAYGDGMNSGAGAGYYKLALMNPNGTEEVSQIAKNGVFGSNDIVEFSFP